MRALHKESKGGEAVDWFPSLCYLLASKVEGLPLRGAFYGASNAPIRRAKSPLSMALYRCNYCLTSPRSTSRQNTNGKTTSHNLNTLNSDRAINY